MNFFEKRQEKKTLMRNLTSHTVADGPENIFFGINFLSALTCIRKSVLAIDTNLQDKFSISHWIFNPNRTVIPPKRWSFIFLARVLLSHFEEQRFLSKFSAHCALFLSTLQTDEREWYNYKKQDTKFRYFLNQPLLTLESEQTIISDCYIKVN